MFNTHRWATWFLVASVSIAACQSSPPDLPQPADGRELIEQVRKEPVPADPGSDEGGQHLEQEVFADGAVTFDEYERAVLAAIKCIRDEGFNVEGPHRYPEGYVVLEPGFDPSLRLTWQYVGDGRDSSEIDARCQAQWLYRIQQVWLRQNEPTESEIQAWLERAWDCAREKDLSLSDPPTVDEALASVSHGCRPWEPS